jgi:hypothetical protein
MENTIAFYKQCIKKLLLEYVALKTEDSQIELIFDDEQMRYMAVWIGWQQAKRIHQCAVHIDIYNKKIVIQWNDTEDLLDEELIKMGVPKKDICLEVIPPNVRKYMRQKKVSSSPATILRDLSSS